MSSGCYRVSWVSWVVDGGRAHDSVGFFEEFVRCFRGRGSGSDGGFGEEGVEGRSEVCHVVLVCCSC